MGGSRGLVEREWVQGCLLLIRAACAEEIGGFWSQLFAYYEEVDFCLRARDAGWRVGVASNALAHEPGTTVPTDRHIYLLTRNSLALIRRHSGRVAFLRRAASIAFNCTRAFAGSIAPWRRPEQRELSRHYAWVVPAPGAYSMRSEDAWDPDESSRLQGSRDDASFDRTVWNVPSC